MFCKPGVCWFKLNIILSILATSTCLGIYMFFGGPPPESAIDIGMKLVYGTSLASIVISFICIISLSSDSKITFLVVFCNIGLFVIFLCSVYARYCLHEVQIKSRNMRDYTQNYFRIHGEPPPFLDSIQRQLHCCGVSSVSDYLEISEPKINRRNNYDDDDDNDDDSSSKAFYKIPSSNKNVIPPSCCTSYPLNSANNCGMKDVKDLFRVAPKKTEKNWTTVPNPNHLGDHFEKYKVVQKRNARDSSFLDLDLGDDDDDDDNEKKKNEDADDQDDDDEKDDLAIHGDEEDDNGSRNGRGSKFMRKIGKKVKYFLDTIVPEAMGSSAFHKYYRQDKFQGDDRNHDHNENRTDAKNTDTSSLNSNVNGTNLLYMTGCGKYFESLQTFVNGFPKEVKEGAAYMNWLVVSVEIKDLYLRFITVFNFILMFVFNYYVIRSRIQRRNRPAAIPRGPPNAEQIGANNIITTTAGPNNNIRPSDDNNNNNSPRIPNFPPPGDMDIININVARSRPRRRSDEAELVHPFMLSAMAMVSGQQVLTQHQQEQLILRNPNNPQTLNQRIVRPIDGGPIAMVQSVINPYSNNNTATTSPPYPINQSYADRSYNDTLIHPVPVTIPIHHGQNQGQAQNDANDVNPFAPSAPPPAYSAVVSPKLWGP